MTKLLICMCHHTKQWLANTQVKSPNVFSHSVRSKKPPDLWSQEHVKHTLRCALVLEVYDHKGIIKPTAFQIRITNNNVLSELSYSLPFLWSETPPPSTDDTMPLTGNARRLHPYIMPENKFMNDSFPQNSGFPKASARTNCLTENLY